MSRTSEVAHTQQVLVSVLRTCWQEGKDTFEPALLGSQSRAGAGLSDLDVAILEDAG